MVNNKWFYCIGFFLFSLVLQAQSDDSAKLQWLKDRYAAQNRAVEKVRAWKVQIMSNVDRRRVESEEKRFEQKFWNYRASWKHDDPYYILKIDNLAYQTKLEILHEFHEIKKTYPDAILVLDEVRKSELSR